MRSMSSGDIFAIIFCAASIICGFIILPVRLGCGRGSRPEKVCCASFGDSVGGKLRTWAEIYSHLAVANQNDTDRDGVRLRA